MISVIIPTCQRPDLLARCLERLAPGFQSLPADQYEVIVTDDGEPAVEHIFAEKFPWASWCLGPRRGPAANRNAGARHARGEWLAFTDDDCVPDRNWLAMFAAAVRDGCQVYEGKTTCEVGIHSPFEHAPVNITGGWLWSCNIFIRRATFEEVGGFDEAFLFPHMEDVDLRDRLIQAGYAFDFVPNAVADHPPRRSPSGWRLARYHESEVYHWYKTGNQELACLRLLYRIIRARMTTMLRHGYSAETIQAIGSLISELFGTILRLPPWEWKYRRRFRTRSPE